MCPSFTKEALEILGIKKNIRLLKLTDISRKYPKNAIDIKKVGGGLLVQEINNSLYNDDDLVVVTKKQPTAEELETMKFAMKVVKHTKSNAIVVAKSKQTIGIGPGQPNRITAAMLAIEHGGEKCRGAVMASDAFFPFSDCVEAAAKAVLQQSYPEARSDQESIDACDKYGIAMVLLMNISNISCLNLFYHQ